LLVSLVVSTALAAVTSLFSSLLPEMEFLAHALDLIVTLGIVAALFAMMFKVLPDVEIAWRDVWIGAIGTAALFGVGKYLIGLYLGASSVSSSYGAAGALVIVLVWVYYSAQILFFGAEFTQVYARHYGSRIVPDEDAVPLTEERRAQQGAPRKEPRPAPPRPAPEPARAATMPASSTASVIAGVLIGLTIRILRASR